MMMKNTYQRTILLTALITFSNCFLFFTYSQNGLNNSDKTAVIKKVQDLIEINYVFEDKAKSICDSLSKFIKTKRFSDIKNHKGFADSLTTELVRISKDKHFKVQYNPGLVKSRRESLEREENNEEEEDNNNDEEIDWNLWYAKKGNFGFKNIEILDGNIGYIKLDFWEPLDWSKPTIDATMQFISHTDALIIDLTDNQGGYSPSDCYLASYFFNEDSTLWMSSYKRRSDETETVYTFEEVGSSKYLDRPVYILISENSFSLAESFTYGMKHFGKATIIGETSAGAAHAIDFIEVDDNYLIQLPISHSMQPITKKDWEGTGVIPHIKTTKEEAIKTAHLQAIRKLIPEAKRKNYQSILKWYESIKLKLTEP